MSSKRSSNIKGSLTASFVAILCLSGCGHGESKSKIEEKKSSITELSVVEVSSLPLHRMLEIPGELRAFQNVALKAKVEGYVSSIEVDRGSNLKRGAKILTIFCPELQEKAREEESKYSSAVSSLAKSRAALDSLRSKQLEARARLDADKLTLSRLQETVDKMPGAVAQNDIDVQLKTVESDNARIASMDAEIRSQQAVVEAEQSNVKAAANVLEATRATRAYLNITAPFEGIITERNVHVGSMVGPDEGHESSLVRIQERDVLRLVVAVPEDAVGGLKAGQQVHFSVPAFPGEKFAGVLTRPAYAIDAGTRTMPVEMDVKNADRRLEPGMFATVQWPVSRGIDTLFVPASAVATDLRGAFINRVKDGVVERVIVQKGQPMQNMVEITGDIARGDKIALNATDELKDGLHVIAHVVKFDSGVAIEKH
jgi:membrane fusion protein (multidrug efflux system)